MRRYETVWNIFEPFPDRPLAELSAVARLPRVMPFEVRISRAFAASHALRLPGGTLEPRHGHGWSVDVTLAADGLDAMDCVIDFHVVEQKLDAILGPWDRKFLNDVEPFRSGVNPSAERVAETVGRALRFENGVRLVSVEVGEATGCVAIYRP